LVRFNGKKKIFIHSIKNKIIDSNFIRELKFDSPLTSLRVLSIKNNRLKKIDGKDLPFLRELYVDENENCIISNISIFIDLSVLSTKKFQQKESELSLYFSFFLFFFFLLFFFFFKHLKLI